MTANLPYFFWIPLLSLLLAVSPAAASDDGEEAYVKVVVNAVEAYQGGDWGQALALFSYAESLSPGARTKRGMGMALFNMRQYAAALVHLNAALADSRRSLTQRHREHVMKLLARCEQQVARGILRDAPADVVVRVDGEPVAPQPDGVVWLEAGERQIEVNASGYQPLQLRVKARPGQVVELALASAPPAQPAVKEPLYDARPAASAEPPAASLPQVTSAAPTAPAATGTAAQPSGSRAHWWTIGAGGLLAAAGGATGVLALRRHRDLERACPDAGCPQGSQRDIDQGRRLAHATTALWVVGGIAVASGTVMALWGRRRTAADVRAGCTGSGCAVSIRGSF